jgi:hypothetical protein
MHTTKTPQKEEEIRAGGTFRESVSGGGKRWRNSQQKKPGV